MRLPSSRSATGWGATVDFSVSGLPTWRVSFPAMGTRFDLVGHGGDLRAITEAACSLVDAHEQLWSVFLDSSDVSRLNASQGWTGVDASTDRLLVDALALSEATGGVFTPLIGAFAALWEGAGGGRALGSGDPATLAPDERERARALRACSPSRLERNDIGQWRLIASSDSAHPRVDLGGVAKGETADRLRDLAVDMGAGGVLVSAGTSSLAAWGTRTSGAPWRIGLRDTVGGADDWAGSVPLRGGALSTSGIPGGASCPPSHRIVDPRTGAAPTAARRQASVLCASGVMADVLSTAILIAGTECVNEEALRRWAHRRGVSAEWEWVVMGDSGVQASAGAGWTPRAGPAHEVRRGAAR